MGFGSTAFARPPLWLILPLLPLLPAIGLLAGRNPELAVFASIGLIFSLVAITNLAVGLTLLVLIVFVESTPIFAVSADKLAVLVLILAWVVRLTTQDADRERMIFSDHPVFFYVLAVFLGWIVLSFTWAESTADALDQLISFLVVAAVYVITYTAIRTRRQAIVLIGSFIAGTAYTAAFGLVTRPSLDTVESGRLVSTIADPNFLALSLIAGIALAGAGIVAAKGHPALKLLAAGVLTICLAAFILTGSRGGILGLAAALLAGILVAGRWRIVTTIAVAVVVTLAVGFYTLYAPPEITDRIESATQGEARQEDGRTTIWIVGWRMVKDHPVRGVGVGNFGSESINYVLEPGRANRTDRVINKPGVSHNSYLGPLAELGAIGLSLFLSIIAFSLVSTVRAARRFAEAGDRPMEALARGLLAALVGMLVAAFFISAEASKQVWLLLALCPALLAVSRTATAEREAEI